MEFEWPDARPFVGRAGRPIRFLAASDERDAALEFERNREAIGAVDGVLGCGDLDPEWLAFLADSFAAPLVYVRGNHDHGGTWAEDSHLAAPNWLRTGHQQRLAGVTIAGLEWPGVQDQRDNRRNTSLAWRHAIALAGRAFLARIAGRAEPVLVISHAPPKGAGDTPADAYHVGFPAYRWLMDRLRPPLWLHGHTTTASVPRLVERVGPTTLINVTGAVLIELCPPGARG